MSDKRPLRIVHCFRSPVGGIFRHVRDLAEHHSKAGHHVGIVCDSSTGSEHEDKLFTQIMPYLALGLERLPIRRSVSFDDLSALRRSYNHIKALQPDILHGHGAKGGVVARVIGSLLRVQRYRVARLYSPHGGSLHFRSRTLSGETVFMAERILERGTEAISFVCDYERSTYEAKIGKPRCDAVRIYNGISDRDFGTVPRAADGADFVYVGMLRDMKGPDVFIEAFDQVERRLGRPLSGRIIGDGPDEQKYRRMLDDKGLANRITMFPAMPVRDAFAMADIVVIPSRAEAMPYIVLEALAAEKTVIASRVGGIPEILGSDSAALVEPGNPSALAAVMTTALTSADWSRRTMPDRNGFHGRFSASVMAAQVEDLYQRHLPKP
jgi:glycosyltransferase involved in cell wall biosynthesis